MAYKIGNVKVRHLDYKKKEPSKPSKSAQQVEIVVLFNQNVPVGSIIRWSPSAGQPYEEAIVCGPARLQGGRAIALLELPGSPIRKYLPVGFDNVHQEDF